MRTVRGGLRSQRYCVDEVLIDNPAKWSEIKESEVHVRLSNISQRLFIPDSRI